MATENPSPPSAPAPAPSPAAKAPATTPPVAVKTAPPLRTREDKVHVWPYLTRMEFLSAIVATIVLTVWSVMIDAPLEEPSNPARTPNPSKAPWYFLGLQEMLVYFDPWIAGVVLPTLIIVGLMCIPYIDPNPKGNGYFTFRDRWFAVTTFCFGFLILWVSLIMLGVFFRGPGWNLFWPWQMWDPHKVVPLNNVDLNEFVALLPVKLWGGKPWEWLLNPEGKNPLPATILGLSVIGVYYAVGLKYFGHLVCRLEGWILRNPKSERPTPASFMKLLGPMRYYTTAFLFVTMMGVPVKMVLRHAFNIKYVVQLPWINSNI